MQITNCRICESRDLTRVLDLGSTALANRFLRPNQLGEVEPRYPLRLLLCGGCGLVQIDENVPRELLFSDYIYVSGTSDLVRRHANWLAESLGRRYRLDPSDLVVEAASNDGTVLRSFQTLGLRVQGVEPAANIAEQANAAGIPSLMEFFDEKAARRVREEQGPAALFIARHVLAHVTDLHGFVQGIASVLGPNGVAVIETPHLAALYENLEFDTIYHEHLCYYSVGALQTLFARFGLQIIDVDKISLHGGSVLVHAAHVHSHHQPTRRVAQVLAAEEDLQLRQIAAWQRFAEQVEEWRNQFVPFLDKVVRRGLKMAGYGAPAKGNTLLAYAGIGPDRLPYVVDKSPLKQGLLTPGQHLPVYPVEKLMVDRPDVTLILAWNFADEIVEQQLDYQRAGGRFAVPIPTPRLLAAKHDRRRRHSTAPANPG
jgi:2-polyprenyl-3-methyl-5-hydroxy-6-metoxy-1,4-benzoquinol methylase